MHSLQVQQEVTAEGRKSLPDVAYDMIKDRMAAGVQLELGQLRQPENASFPYRIDFEFPYRIDFEASNT